RGGTVAMRIVKLVIALLLLTDSKWPSSEIIQDTLRRMVRKPRPRQYLGLMGKKAAKAQMTHKRKFPPRASLFFLLGRMF
uniref:Uncharacterized protein n=1 Tax=Myripristis murdjan TaxID=586833 RepID=A0A667X7U0_9TELE